MNGLTRKHLVGLGTALVISAWGVASAQEAGRDVQVALAQDSPDAKFLTEAVRGNLAEVKMGELAQQRGQSEATREFGMMLVEDHSKALKETAELAKDMDIVPPAQPTAEQTAKHDELAALSGGEFDAQFAAEMVKDHQQDIAKYEKQAQSGDSKVSKLAEEMLPTLREHLMAAQRLQSGEQATGNHERSRDSER